MVYGRIIGVVAVMILGAALVLGCGDEGEAASEVTKAEFTKEAEAICAERKKDWDAEMAVFGKENKAEYERTGKVKNFKESNERAQEFFDASLLPLLKEEMEALEALELPEADEAKIEKMLQSRAQGIKAVEDEGVIVLGQRDTFGSFEKESKAYGLSCPLF